MKTIYTIGFLFILFMGKLFAQDTVYVMQKGVVKYKMALSDLDSVSFVNTLDIRKSIVENIAKDTRFSLFFEALKTTGLTDSLRSDKDNSYVVGNNSYWELVEKNQQQWFYQEFPPSKLYGFTAFIESNATLQKFGISSLTDLKAYAKTVYDKVYPEDAGVQDLTDRRNSLNRFISYHLINKRLSANKLIDAFDTDHMVKTVDMFEYLETMCPNTLMEISKIRSTGKTNQINRSIKTGTAIQILASSENDPKYNGVYHEIDMPLVYSKDFVEELSAKRLRFDFASIFPELTNNNLRGRGMTLPNLQFKLPAGYLERFTNSASTYISLLTPYNKYQNYEGDELSVSPINGKVYDFSVVLPPLPAGTYEVRYGYLTNGKRGVADFYFDNQAIGQPINMNPNSTVSEIGYISPGNDPADPFGFENDKTLRTHGYMKAPASFRVPVPGWSNGENARMSYSNLRKILGTFSFAKATQHVLTVKGLSAGEFQLDFIEFVPTSLLETEDIY